MKPSTVDDSATPSAAALSGFHRCAWGRRMSNKTYDHHYFCVHCRDYSCDFINQCDEFKVLPDKIFLRIFVIKIIETKESIHATYACKAAEAAAVFHPVLTPVVSPSASALSEGVVDVIERHRIVENPTQSGISLYHIKELLGSSR